MALYPGEFNVSHSNALKRFPEVARGAVHFGKADGPFTQMYIADVWGEPTTRYFGILPRKRTIE